MNLHKLRGKGGGGGGGGQAYLHEKKPKYTYTLIYIYVHKLNLYSVLSVNRILHLKYVFDECSTYIFSLDDGHVDIHDHILNINIYSFLCIGMYSIYLLQSRLK